MFDPYYLYPPLCVLCMPDSSLPLPVTPDKKDALVLSDFLKQKKWLFWEGGTGAQSLPRPESAIYVGQAGGRRFYAATSKQFADFMILTLPQPTSPGGVGASKQRGFVGEKGTQGTTFFFPGSTEGNMRPYFMVPPQAPLPPPQ
ncbi:MAG TPA: hypothetical protein VN808_00350 [Stellaceae bacterium]|nr:hypothetical protein [Stellaceae bacterium]